MSEWVDVGSLDELATSRQKLVREIDGNEVLVLGHGGQLFAFANICIHKGRELHKGVILNGKLVCPGHQWAFVLETGYEAVKEMCQPTHDVRVVDGRIEVGRHPRPDPVAACNADHRDD